MNKHSQTYDRSQIDSDYLCIECGYALYVLLGSDGEGSCLNDRCSLWIGVGLYPENSPEAAPKLHAELRSEEAEILEMLSLTDRDALTLFAATKRQDMSSKFLTNGMLESVTDWRLAGDVLLWARSSSTSGGKSDSSWLNSVWGAIERNVNHLNMIENIDVGRHRIALDQRHFELKYSRPYSLGLAQSGFLAPRDVEELAHQQPYENIRDGAMAVGDWEDMRANPSWPRDFAQLADQLGLATHTHKRVTAQYQYQPREVFIRVLEEMFYNIPSGQISEIRESDLTPNFLSHANESALDDLTYFLEQLSDSSDLVPLLPRLGNSLAADSATIFIYLIILECSISPPGEASYLAEYRTNIGPSFESWLRDQLRDAGYSGPDVAINVPKSGPEYDILMISESRKTILLADAKAVRIPASNFTEQGLVERHLLGYNPVKGELTGRGLLDEAVKQQRRLEHFNNNRELFGQYLNPKHDWHDYQVTSYLATMDIPIIERYRDTLVTQGEKLVESELLTR